MSTKIYSDKFPREGFESETYDKRKVIVFAGYEAIQQPDGSWRLIATPGGHDAPHSIADEIFGN